jgi:predicted amidohydrolase
MQQVYLIPEGVSKAKAELIYRWDADGVVHFGGFSFAPIEKPEPRTVRLATVNHQPSNSTSSLANLEQFGRHVETAAGQGADIVCLPEAITLVGTGLNYVEASESIPGPSTEYLGKIAKAHGLYIVAGLLEKEQEVVYNTSVFIDRQGNVAGKYRKVSLPREEIEGGVTPGDALPVFNTDFGTIGMMICWDVTFPESARTLAKKGAEVIFLPIWGGNITLAKARAIENQVYLVSSSYNMKTAIFDLEGEIIAEATDENPVVVAEIDLNEQKLWPWLGDFKNRIAREMPSKEALEAN